MKVDLTEGLVQFFALCDQLIFFLVLDCFQILYSKFAWLNSIFQWFIKCKIWTTAIHNTSEKTQYELFMTLMIIFIQFNFVLPNPMNQNKKKKQPPPPQKKRKNLESHLTWKMFTNCWGCCEGWWIMVPRNSLVLDSFHPILKFWKPLWCVAVSLLDVFFSLFVEFEII